MPLEPSSSQPKIVQKLLLRTAGFLLLMALVFGGMRYVQGRKGDYDNGGTSVGLVSAIQTEREGQKAVLIGADGATKTTKTWKDGVNDREAVWSPDGKFLFFASDRAERTFHIFRWNPDADDAEQRTLGAISRGNPTFEPDASDSLLVVAGGTVRELDPVTKKTPQILPPTSAEVAQGNDPEGSQGTQGAFSAAYGALGNSFRVARYFKDKTWIAAVMRRDEGELLVLQSLTMKEDRFPRPIPVIAGDRVDFDVNLKDGTVAFVVQNFRWPSADQIPPQYRKGNRITVPFRHVLGIVDPNTGTPQIVGASTDDKVAFGSPRVSPDGTRLLAVQGTMEEGGLRSKGMITMPYAAAGARSASPLAEGEVYEPSWSLDGARIVYVKRVGGKRDVFTMNADGSNDASLTKGKGDFSNPIFSPQASK